MTGHIKVLIAILAMSLLCAAANALATWHQSGSDFYTNYHAMEGFGEKIVFTGDVHLWSGKKPTKAVPSFDAHASKLTVVLLRAGGQEPRHRGGAYKERRLRGAGEGCLHHHIIDQTPRSPRPKAMTRFTRARAGRWNSGHVKITQEDASRFQEPAVATGDKATVNMKPELGPDERRFIMRVLRVEHDRSNPQE